jgi:molecular chaperone DnaK
MPIIGIDLGTTFSVVAFVDEHGHPDTLLNTEGQPLTASALWIDEDANMIVGQLALDSAIAYPDDVITMAKRSMGHDVKLKARDKEFTPQEVSAIILKKLKQDAERHFGQPVDDAVITCPAFFGAAETQATEEAGKMAGFNVRRIFPEPAAAALAFGYDNPGQEQTLLVYDLGGGTFDITLFKIGAPEPGSTTPKIEMISTDGDRQLGGADWNTRVVDWVAEAFVAQQGKTILLNALKDKVGGEDDVRKALDTIGNLPPTAEAVGDELVGLGFDQDRVKTALKDVAFDPRTVSTTRQELYSRVERAKIALARVAKTAVVCQHEGFSLKVDLMREKFAELTKDLLDRTEQAIDRLLDAKGYTKDQIHQVLCAGGSTRMSMVRDMLQRKFPGRVNTQIEPDLCVAQGAARMAKLIETGNPHETTISLSPHAYGVLALGEDGKPHVYPVILKDEKLPCASARPNEQSRPDYQYGQFYTASDGQARVPLEVYEFDGLSHQELQDKESCRKIGSVFIENLPPNRPRGQQVFATFELDESLQLTVSALDVSSGATKSVQLTLGDAKSDEIQKNAVRSAAMSRLLQDTEVKS